MTDFISEKKGRIWNLQMRVERGRGGEVEASGGGRQLVGGLVLVCAWACPVGSGICGSGAAGQLVLRVFLVAPGEYLLSAGVGAGPPQKYRAVCRQD